MPPKNRPFLPTGVRKVLFSFLDQKTFFTVIIFLGKTERDLLHKGDLLGHKHMTIDLRNHDPS